MELLCKVEGDPSPEIEWRKDGRLVTPKRGVDAPGGLSEVVLSPDGSTLTVYSVSDATSGIFTCSAINTHGAVSKEFHVTVKSKSIWHKHFYCSVIRIYIYIYIPI